MHLTLHGMFFFLERLKEEGKENEEMGERSERGKRRKKRYESLPLFYFSALYCGCVFCLRGCFVLMC